MLMLIAALLTSLPTADTVRSAAAPIQVSLNNDGNFAPGGLVNVRVQSAEDGYLMVFRVDGDGRIRVVFPLDPDADAFVRGGKEYELRGRGDHGTFLADDRGGDGMVYAALSHQPYNVRGFSANGHWDYDALRLRDSTTDAENDLTGLVSQMTDHARFDYDAVGYRVQEIGTVAAVSSGVGGGYYPGFYDPYYNPSWRCLGCGWGYPGSDISLGLNFGYSPFYDPWLYSPWGYNSAYSYGYNGFGNPYFPGTYPIVINRHSRPWVTPRPRPRPVGSYPPRAGAAPAVRTPPPDVNAGRRARPRPADEVVVPRAFAPGGRPVFRQPPRTAAPAPQVDRGRPEPTQARPVYREPPHVDRAPPPPPASQPSAHSAPPPSQHSSPPASRPRPGGGGRH